MMEKKIMNDIIVIGNSSWYIATAFDTAFELKEADSCIEVVQIHGLKRKKIKKFFLGLASFIFAISQHNNFALANDTRVRVTNSPSSSEVFSTSEFSKKIVGKAYDYRPDCLKKKVVKTAIGFKKRFSGSDFNSFFNDRLLEIIDNQRDFSLNYPNISQIVQESPYLGSVKSFNPINSSLFQPEKLYLPILGLKPAITGLKPAITGFKFPFIVLSPVFEKSKFIVMNLRAGGLLSSNYLLLLGGSLSLVLVISYFRLKIRKNLGEEELTNLPNFLINPKEVYLWVIIGIFILYFLLSPDNFIAGILAKNQAKLNFNSHSRPKKKIKRIGYR